MASHCDEEGQNGLGHRVRNKRIHCVYRSDFLGDGQRPRHISHMGQKISGGQTAVVSSKTPDVSLLDE